MKQGPFRRLSRSLLLALCTLGMILAPASASPGRRAVQPAPLPIPLPAPATSAQPAGLRLATSDERGIVLELATPNFQVEQTTADGSPCDRLVVDGYAATDAPGYPELPIKGALVGIPPLVSVTLSVLDVESQLLPGQYDLCPVPRPIVDDEPPGELRYLGAERVRDAQAYAAHAFSPTAPAELVSTGLIRSQRVAQVRFQPFQYNPATGQVRHLSRIRVRLGFSSPAARQPAAAAAPQNEGPFEEILRASLANYADAYPWRAQPQAAATDTVALSGDQLKIQVNADGLYQVTPADLQAAGLDTGQVDPRTFRLFNQGQEVAIHIPGEADGSFDAGDVLLFYGQQMNTKYTTTNVYWLAWGGSSGLRMPAVDGTPSGTAPVPAYFLTTRRMEQDRMYQSPRPSGPENDHWYWDYLFAAGKPVTKKYTTTLQYLAVLSATTTFRGLLRGWSANPEHHTQVYLNGRLVDEATWSPQVEHAFETSIPVAYLLRGVNTISVTAGISNTRDLMLVNRFEIDYPATYTADGNQAFFDGDQAGTWQYRVSGFTTATLELLDITAPAQPARILNAAVQAAGGVYTLTFQQTSASERRYLALATAQRQRPLRIERAIPSNLRSASNGADYVIITHGSFYTAVQPLATYNVITRGLRTAVVDARAIYDEFSYGVFDPTAMRSFLAYAYANWARPAPTFVLLVGDGNYDFKNNLGYGEPNYIPPYLADVDPWMGEVAADNRYVCVSGDDLLPDMHLGRLPVKTSAEADAVVAKLIGYAQNPPGGNWNRQVLFATDNAPDPAGDFYAFSDAVADRYLPAPYTAHKVYYGLTHPTSSGARTAIINAINEGRLLVNYVGHGGTPFWAESLFRLADIAALTNSPRLPFWTPMTCLVGNYIIPSPAGTNNSSLDESLVRAANKGAVATWSPTGLGVASGHDFLNRALYKAIFFDDVVQLGPATLLAKLALVGNAELLDTYILFGDPALRLNVLKADVGIAQAVSSPGPLRPGDPITYTLTCSNTGPATAHHIVISDALPAALVNPVISASFPITPRLGSRFVWDAPDLVAGASRAITIAATIGPTFTGAFTHAAHIATSAVETTTANNATGPVTTQVIVPDLSIQKRGPAKGRPGLPVTYSLVYSNNGPATADQVTINDMLPDGLLGVTAAYTYTGPVLALRPGPYFVWDIPRLGAGEGGVITITAIARSTFTGTLVNTAQIASAIFETNTTNNQAGPILTQMEVPDLVLHKDGPALKRSGAPITYTLAYFNAGDAPATQVVITDSLPAQLLGADWTSSGPAVTRRPGSSFAWDVANVEAGQGGIITISATISPGFVGLITNSAVIATAKAERSTANNTTAPVVTGVDVPDLIISKQGPAEALPGSRITYTLAYSNAGLAAAPQVVITDILPAALSDVSVVTGTVLLPRPRVAYAWDMGDLAPGEGGRITITGMLDPGFIGVISNTATITAPVVERNVNNTAGPVWTNVGVADLAIRKQAPVEVLVGAQITYSLAYSNAGSLPARGVVISDELPAELSTVQVITSGTPIALREGSRLVWDVGDLAPGDGGLITITAAIAPTFVGKLANTARIASTAFEFETANNTAGPVLTDVGIADLAIDKRGPAEALSGAWITYTLLYSNTGSLPARGVVIADALPAELTSVRVISAGAALTFHTGSRLAWDAAELAPGDWGVITITAVTSATFAGVLTNTATITAATPELSLANNAAGAVTTRVGQPDLVMRKRGPAEIFGRDRITYTLAYENAGSLPARGVVISDVWPATLLDPIVRSSGAAIALRPGSRFVWDVADLAPGAGGVITITARLDPSHRGVLVNTATITSASGEAVPGTNTATRTTQVWRRWYLPLWVYKF